MQMSQAELPPLPAHALADDRVPRRLSKPFVPPRRAKGGSLSGPRVHAAPTDDSRDTPVADAGGGSRADVAAQDGGKASVPGVVPDTQEAETERDAQQTAVVAADIGAQRQASSSAAAGLEDAAPALPVGPACASVSCNPRCRSTNTLLLEHAAELLFTLSMVAGREHGYQ